LRCHNLPCYHVRSRSESIIAYTYQNLGKYISENPTISFYPCSDRVCISRIQVFKSGGTSESVEGSYEVTQITSNFVKELIFDRTYRAGFHRYRAISLLLNCPRLDVIISLTLLCYSLRIHHMSLPSYLLQRLHQHKENIIQRNSFPNILLNHLTHNNSRSKDQDKQ